MKEKLATAILNIMYMYLDRDVDLRALEEAKIYAEHIFCSTDNISTILEWLDMTELKYQVTKQLCENVSLCVEFEKADASQKAMDSDIRAFYIEENKEDIEISVESAMRLYLGIDCFSGVLR